MFWKLSKRVLRLFFPKWILDDLESRFTHPYWRKKEGELTSRELVSTASITERREKTSSRPPFKRINEKRVLDTLRSAGARRILDVGCGQGTLVRYLEDKGFEIFGVTINPEEVKLANHERILLVDIQGDLAQTPLVDMQFDAILSFDCLEHLESPIVGLQNINRLLRTGGLFIAYLPPSRWVECDYHVIVYTPRQFRWLLNLKGFVLDREEGRHFYSNRGTTYFARKRQEDGPVFPGVLD